MHFKKFEDLREFEFIFEKDFPHPRTDVLMKRKKTEGRKSRDTVPLITKKVLYYLLYLSLLPTGRERENKLLLYTVYVYHRTFYMILLHLRNFEIFFVLFFTGNNNNNISGTVSNTVG
jgi:hypothetical protein